eukprot:jgi/Tetstr1/462868/TSEL_007817.t1
MRDGERARAPARVALLQHATRGGRPLATARRAPRRGAASTAVVRAHGGKASVAEPNKMAGFVGEMRKVAMKLHTREQAPIEGKREDPRPQRAFAPTREGYLKFLVESKVVYGTLESIIAEAASPEFARFQDSGLERSEALARDIAWMADTYGMEVPQPKEDGPGMEYSRLLREFAEREPPAFICHYYNTYFAHTAGGRMIGSKVASMCLDGAELEFYKYEGDLTEMLEAVRGDINALAEAWTQEQKQRCLDETMNSFKYSGSIMQAIMS